MTRNLAVNLGWALALAAGVFWAWGCERAAEGPAPRGERPKPAPSIALRSGAFEDGKPIPKVHTGEGADLSPALSWPAPPAGTKQWALIVDDPDAPRPLPWVHWVVYGIPAEATSLPEGAGAKGKTATGVLEGKNSSGRTGWAGPMPPPGHGVHHYHFKLYALDVELSLEPGLTKRQLLDAIAGHVLAEGELVGTYERK